MSAANQITESVPMVGRVLGGSYRVVGLIDRGGHGCVYAAEHVRIGTPLAVKMLVGASAHDDDQLARFAHEAEILACLRHPHVVSIVDFDFVDGQPYFVMERLEGETLYQRLRRVGSLSLAEALRIAEQMSSGLAAAHDAGIVHRDLKPGNIFLVSARGEPDFVKLLDFGISRSYLWPLRSGPRRKGHHHEGEPRQLWGTPHYMAPEQASGLDEVDARTDQFALAVVLWEMLTGSPPFLGESVTEVLMAIVDGDVPHLEEDYAGVFPEAIDPVLARAMAQRIEDRYPDVATFVDALRLASGLPRSSTLPPPAPDSEPVEPPSPRPSGVAAFGERRSAPGRMDGERPVREDSEPTLAVDDDLRRTEPNPHGRASPSGRTRRRRGTPSEVPPGAA